VGATVGADGGGVGGGGVICYNGVNYYHLHREQNQEPTDASTVNDQNAP
jgi:hypothetical protein